VTMSHPSPGSDDEVAPWDPRRVVTRLPIGFVVSMASMQTRAWTAVWAVIILAATLLLAALDAHPFAYAVLALLTAALLVAGTRTRTQRGKSHRG
jgi:hypothetical protein